MTTFDDAQQYADDTKGTAVVRGESEHKASQSEHKVSPIQAQAAPPGQQHHSSSKRFLKLNGLEVGTKTMVQVGHQSCSSSGKLAPTLPGAAKAPMSNIILEAGNLRPSPFPPPHAHPRPAGGVEACAAALHSVYDYLLGSRSADLRALRARCVVRSRCLDQKGVLRRQVAA